MSDTPAPTSPEEISELIREFEQYRERLVNDTIATARKAKLPKSAVMAQLEPELARIDTALAHLRKQQPEAESGTETAPESGDAESTAEASSDQASA